MKETIRRTMRTFFQAAAGYIVAHIAYMITLDNVENFDYIKHVAVCIAVSAIAAGIAALMNLPKAGAEAAAESIASEGIADSADKRLRDRAYQHTKKYHTGKQFCRNR